MQTLIPNTMRAIILEEHHPNVDEAIRRLRVMERPVPQPGRNQVLVRMEAAPCHPSDLLFIQGKYGERKTLPSVPGREGAGQVVANGPGWTARLLKGTRVACAVQGDRDGTWAQYLVADAMNCIPLRRKLRLQQAATLIANPLTAVGLLETARCDGHRAAVHTAAASQLGRMMIPMAEKLKFPVICVVRQQEHVQLLQSLGAEHVLDSSAANFEHELKSLSARLSATAVFEAIAGETTGVVLGCLPEFSHLYLYGALSEEPCGRIDPIDLIFNQKLISGFYLPHWVKRRGVLRVVRSALSVQNMLISGEIETTVHRRLALDEVVEGLRQYVADMTIGKMLIMPHKS